MLIKDFAAGLNSNSSMVPLAANAQDLLSTPGEPVAGNYFVAAYPPFSCWQPSEITEVRKALAEPPRAEPVGLYVHVPFCQKKCDFCYYLSYVGSPAAVVDHYIESLIDELKLYCGQPAVGGRSVSFVYFGGGTPSILSERQLRRLMEGLKSLLCWKEAREVTFECAPRSVRPAFLKCLRDLGVTRLSMGVQSFDNHLLRLNGRVHLAEDVFRAYELIGQSGFDWVNLDLMVGLLGETEANWEDSVTRLLEFSPDSVTIYQTEMPHNTLLYQDFKADRLPGAVISWDTKRQRLNAAFERLERGGYSVVSGYCAVKDPARHVFQYPNYLWRGGDMIGLGVASFSYFGGVHYQNASTLESYCSPLAQGHLPLHRAIRLGTDDQLVREFILQLKWGAVDAGSFRVKFGMDLADVFAPQLGQLASEGFLTFSREGVRLTRAGLLRVDRLLPLFYDAQFQATRYT